MKKRIRFTCVVLMLTLVLQLLPLNLFGVFVQRALAAEVPSALEVETGYASQTQSAAENTVTAELPPTFIYEIFPEEEKVASSESEISPVVQEEDSVESLVTIDPLVDFSEPVADAESIRYVEILAAYTYYTDLSEEDRDFLVAYTGIETDAFETMAMLDLPLITAVTYGALSSTLGLPLIGILEQAPTLEECRVISRQTALYKAMLDPALEGTELDMELRGYLLQGFSLEQVRNAYGIQETLGIPMEELLTDAEPSVLTTEQNVLSEELGVSSVALAAYAEDSGQDAEEMEELLPEIEEAAATLSSSTTAEPEEVTDVASEQLTGAPYTYNAADNEKVALNSGALVYETVDYTLPGINGLDLVIGRRYNSQEARTHTHIGQMIYVESYVYYAYIYAEAYCELDGGYTGRWSEYDIEITDGPYDTIAEAEAVIASLVPAGGVSRIEDFEVGADLVYYYSSAVLRAVDGYGYFPRKVVRDNTYSSELYGLGYGWSLMFSSIEIEDGGKYLHLSDGRTYKINLSDSNYSNLEDYLLDDMQIVYESNEFTNGSENSKYTLTFADGRKEFFSSKGKLLGIQDRYGNTITFVHSTVDGYPHITITDTLGRTVVISGEATETGHVMTVSLPEAATLTYQMENLESEGYMLASYQDPMGNTTNYSYTVQSAGLNALQKNTTDKTNTYLNLTSITHPTQAQSVYTYSVGERNLGEDGLTEIYRVASRADLVGAVTVNAQTYTYSENDCSGYPAYDDPEALEDETDFTYGATVTDGGGLTTAVTFNNLHLQTLQEVSFNGSKRKTVEYTYDSYELPIQEKVSLYSADNQTSPLVSITAAEHDSKGNVVSSWSALAGGDTTNTEYKTTYTYDATYNLPLTTTYKTNTGTTVQTSNTLGSDKKSIIQSDVFGNSTLVRRTTYGYDEYGNVVSEYRYGMDFESYTLTSYAYQNNGYLSQTMTSGILDADGGTAMPTPGQADGVVVTESAYDALGRLSTSTDANGNTTNYSYDALGNVTQITNPDNTTVSYTRDYANNRVTVTDENGAQVMYTYTPLGLEYQTVDVLTGLVISSKEYDSMSRLVSVSDFVYGSVTEYTYDELGRGTSETVYQGDEVLAQTLYAYDDAAESGQYQKVTKTVVGDANAPSVVTTEYTDAYGNLAKTGKVLDDTEYFDVYTYDYAGNVLSHLSSADAQKGLEKTAGYTYNEFGQVTRTENALGQYTTNTYDNLGQLTAVTDYAGGCTNYAYDDLGRLLSQSTLMESGVWSVLKYAYDPAGNVIAERTPTNAIGYGENWAETEYVYNSRQRLTAAVRYDPGYTNSVTCYTYDGVGNMLTVTTGLTYLEELGGRTTTYTYDRFGNVLTMTDPLGQTETYTYSSLGRLESKTDRNGVTTTYTYDALGRLLCESAGSGTYKCYEYTKTGNVAKEYNADQLTTYTYDSLGRVTEVTEAKGITLTFDAAGGSCSVSTMQVYVGDVYDLPTPTRDGYEFLGWYVNGNVLVSTGDLITVTSDVVLEAKWSATGETYTITFNAAATSSVNSEATTATQTAVLGADVTLDPNPFTRTGYLFKGWSTAASSSVVVYTNGQTIEGGLISSTSTERNVNLYAIWTKQSVQTMSLSEEDYGVAPAVEAGPNTTPGTGSTANVIQKDYSYDLAGNVTEFELKYGANTVSITTYGYDTLNRLSTVSEDGVLQATYTYDTNGNRASLTYANGVVTSYTYNLANWVTSVTNTLDGEVLSSYTYTYYLSGNQETKTDHEGVVTSYNYDAQGRLTGENDSTGWKAYLYDAAGNRTNLYVGGTEEYSVTYTYDANDRLLTESKSQNETTTTTLYSYDANGNLISQQDASTGQIELSAYDGFNQLVRLESGGQIITYAYNARGIRTGRYVQSGEQKEFLLDGGNVVAEVTNSVVSSTYLWGMNLISGASGDATSYYLYNAHGDVVQLTDSAGTVTKTYAYDAFGNETDQDETDTNPFRYCGEYYDTETGHYYLRARYYDPTVGRFTQEDTYRGDYKDPLSLNYYTYCYNNPVRYCDRSGNIPIETILDLLSLFSSLKDFANDPSLSSFGFLAWDLASLVIPYLPGSYTDDIGKASLKLMAYADNYTKAGVWAMKPFKRGWEIERRLGGFCNNFKTLDYFDVVSIVGDTKQIDNLVSIKSIDLTRATYQNPNKLSSKLHQYLDDLLGFERYKYGGYWHEASENASRILYVAIPPYTMTAEQAAEFEKFIDEATKEGVTVIITTIE